MVGANQVPLVLCKELIIHPVHRQGNMATPIHISKNLFLIADQKAFNGFSLTKQLEFFRCPMWKLRQPADYFAFPKFLHRFSSISQISQKGKISLRAADQDISLIQ
jgi:hypothetical protein